MLLCLPALLTAGKSISLSATAIADEEGNSASQAFQQALNPHSSGMVQAFRARLRLRDRGELYGPSGCRMLSLSRMLTATVGYQSLSCEPTNSFSLYIYIHAIISVPLEKSFLSQIQYCIYINVSDLSYQSTFRGQHHQNLASGCVLEYIIII